MITFIVALSTYAAIEFTCETLSTILIGTAESSMVRFQFHDFAAIKADGLIKPFSTGIARKNQHKGVNLLLLLGLHYYKPDLKTHKDR